MTKNTLWKRSSDPSEWQGSSDPSEIMEIIKDLDRVDKFIVLDYFGIDKMDLDMVTKLLKSGYYTPQEIIDRGPRAFKKWDYAPTRNMLLAFVNQVWQKLDNVQDILNTKIGLLPSDVKEYQMKLNYFKVRNPQIHSLLAKEISKLGEDGLKIYFGTLLQGNFNKNKQEIVELAIKYPYLKKSLNHLVENERIIIIMLENIKLQESQHRGWKTLTDPQSIMYRANNRNKWEILEYFARKDEGIFKAIIEDCTMVNASQRLICYKRDEVLRHYKDVDLKSMPAILRDYIESLKQEIDNLEDFKDKQRERATRRKAERLKSWEEKGSPIRLFKLGHITPKTRDDYERILKRYLDENVATTLFCSKYGIDDHAGLIRMLNKFIAEDEDYASQIQNQWTEHRNKFLEKSKQIVYAICENGEDVGQFMKYSKSLPLEELQSCARNLSKSQDKNYYEILTTKVIEYYYKRLNSYTSSIEPENILKMLTVDEIIFIVGREEYNHMLAGKNVKLYQIFYERVHSLYSATNRDWVTSMLASKQNGGVSIMKGLSKYNDKFNKKEYLKDKTTLVTESGESVVVTEEMVDMAFHYAVSNGLYASYIVMNRLIKSIANGKIDNLQEMCQAKAEMQNRALDLVKEVSDIDEYFILMGSQKR